MTLLQETTSLRLPAVGEHSLKAPCRRDHNLVHELSLLRVSQVGSETLDCRSDYESKCGQRRLRRHRGRKDKEDLMSLRVTLLVHILSLVHGCAGKWTRSLYSWRPRCGIIHHSSVGSCVSWDRRADDNMVRERPRIYNRTRFSNEGFHYILVIELGILWCYGAIGDVSRHSV